MRARTCLAQRRRLFQCAGGFLYALAYALADILGAGLNALAGSLRAFLSVVCRRFPHPLADVYSFLGCLLCPVRCGCGSLVSSVGGGFGAFFCAVSRGCGRLVGSVSGSFGTLF